MVKYKCLVVLNISISKQLSLFSRVNAVLRFAFHLAYFTATVNPAGRAVFFQHDIVIVLQKMWAVPW